MDLARLLSGRQASSYQPKWWEIIGQSAGPALVQRYEQNSQQQAKQAEQKRLAQVLMGMPEGKERVNYLLQNGMTDQAMQQLQTLEKQKAEQDALTYELEQKNKYIYEPKRELEQARINETNRHNTALESTSASRLGLDRQKLGLEKEKLGYELKALQAKEKAQLAEVDYQAKKEVISYIQKENKDLEGNTTIKNFKTADQNLQSLINIEKDDSLTPQIKEYATLMIYLKTQGGEAVNQGDVDTLKAGGPLSEPITTFLNRLRNEGTSLQQQLPSMRKTIANIAKAKQESALSLVDQGKSVGSSLVRRPGDEALLNNLGLSVRDASNRVNQNADRLRLEAPKIAGFGGVR